MSDKDPDIFDRLKNSDGDNGGRFADFDFFANPGRSAYGILLAITGIILLIVFKDFIFGEKYYLFKGVATDSIDALYPYLYNAAKTFPAHGWPSWSFNYGMGQNTFPFFLRDPFDLLLYFGGRQSMAGSVIFVELIKILLTVIIVYRFLKLLGLNALTAIVGSLYFSFCGYMIIGGVWHFFSFEVLNMAILLLAFELLWQRNRWILFPLPFFFIGISMPLKVYFFGLFLIAYTIFRVLHCGSKSFRDVAVLLFKIAGLSAAGLMAAGPFLLENSWVLFHNARVGGANSLSHILFSYPARARMPLDQVGTTLLRFFSNDITGLPDAFRGWHNTFESPQFWIGLLTLLALWLLPIFFPWLRFAFWAFTGNYFRIYSFLVCLLIWVPSMFALDRLIAERRLNLSLLGFTVAGLVVLLFFPWFRSNDVIYRPQQMLVLLFLLIHSGVFYLLSQSREKALMSWLLLLVVVTETVAFNYSTVNGWIAATPKDLATPNGYNDSTVFALRKLAALDHGFYRIDKNYYSSPGRYYSYNDALIQDYNGTSSYGSFNEFSYVNFLQTCGLANPKSEVESRWARGLAFHPVFESQNQVKYFLSKKNLNPEWFLLADSLFKTGNVTVYRNRLCLPFGFTSDRYIPLSRFNALSPDQKACAASGAFVVADADVKQRSLSGLTPIEFTDTTIADTGGASIVQQVRLLDENRPLFLRDTLVVDHFSDGLISGEITCNRTELLYLSVPHDNGWAFWVDGKPASAIVLNGGMCGLYLTPGRHDLKLEYHLYFLGAGWILSLTGFALWTALYFINRRRKLAVTRKTA